MDIKDFKSGVYQHQTTGYKSFIPNEINHSFVWSNPQINVMLEKATLELGALNSFSHFVPDIGRFIKMHVAKEATQSSRIEGTQTNIADVFVSKEIVDPERRNDKQEVENYINAMNSAIEALPQLPLSSRLLKNTHRLLLQHVRGEHKCPGEFRRSQNWIGGASINDAAFVPPPASEVERLMGDLENFLHNESLQIPHLIKIAIAHYQFETIHPFLDGNGRVGRLLITLYFIANGIIDKPILYVSDFFEKYKPLYYSNLTIARENNDLEQWIKFFLEAVTQSCKNATQCLQDIMLLRQKCEGERVQKMGKRAANARILLDHLYSSPIVNAQDVANVLQISVVSAYNLIETMEENGILRQMNDYKRNKLYCFYDYMNLFNR
jgi:Fic family protein